MTERVLGEKGSKRRKRFVLLPALVTTAFALFWVAGAQAVHDLGLFELDRNATAEAAPGDDWSTLYGGGGSQESFTGVLPDIGAGGGTQFQGGGSKDDLDIPSWLWKAGEPLDKDDITNAYAAAYTNTVDTGENDVGDMIVYFGLDRFSVAGSAQVGFWFLQDPDFGLTQTASGGGFKFSGVHQDDDILVQSNFTNGGVLSNLTVYKWESGGLVEVTGVDASDCVGPPSSDADDGACATVNQSPTSSPWPYVPKANEGTSGTFPISAFFEGGINITRLVPNVNCFAGFMAETRSSTPFDSRLKDFVLGDFGHCVPSIESDQSWVPNDTATVTVPGATTWQGDVTFKLYPNTACTAGTEVYTETPTPSPNVSISDPTVSTSNPGAPAPGYTALEANSGNFAWGIHFESGTSGVDSTDTCIETTTLTIDDDTTSP